MEEIKRPTAASSSTLPFIAWSAASGVDEATRKAIRSHVMRGKKKRKIKCKVPLVKKRSDGAASDIRIELQDVVDMQVALQPGYFSNRLYFVDFPSEIEPSMLVKMAQGSCNAGVLP